MKWLAGAILVGLLLVGACGSEVEDPRDRAVVESGVVQEQTSAVEEAKAEEKPPAAAEPSCDPNYSGVCMDPDSPDYDCEGGSGDGPDYVGTVRVAGDDIHDLDRDGDGIACDD